MRIQAVIITAAAVLLLSACDQASPPAAPDQAAPPVVQNTAPVIPAAVEPAVNSGYSRQATDTLVEGIEARVKTDLSRKEVALTESSLKGISEGSWAKIHAYFDFAGMHRIKLYPSSGSEKTEEFYFSGEALVMVALEAQGLSEQDDKDAPGEHWYFEAGVLRAVLSAEDSELDASTPERVAMGAKLVAEAAALMKIAKT